MISYNKVNPRGCDIVMLLLRKTEKNELSWVPFNNIMEYLNREGISLQRIDVLYSYIVFQQHSRYIPNMSRNIFVTIFEDKVAVLAQGTYSAEMRLTVLNLSDVKRKWKVVDATQVSLVRLRDTIELYGIYNSEQDCQELLYSMGNISV